MDQLIKFYLKCDVADNPRYRDATQIAKEIHEHIEKNDDPSSG